MRITIQMLYTNSWMDIARITVPNVINYCLKNGYSWNIQCINEPYDGFEKLRQIKSIFKDSDDIIVFSLDCDLLITNYAIKVEQFLDNHNDIYICKDYNGLNAGTFIIKSSIWTSFFLTWTISMSGKLGVHCEQNAIEEFMKDFPKENKIKILPHPSINSYDYSLYENIPPQTHEQGRWQEGDFILHLPGVGMRLRKEILSNTKVIQ